MYRFWRYFYKTRRRSRIRVGLGPTEEPGSSTYYQRPLDLVTRSMFRGRGFAWVRNDGTLQQRSLHKWLEERRDT